jgi:MFS family permease
MRQVSLRLLPFLLVLYIVNFLDRTNVAIAALEMNRDLRFSASAYGLGSGIFFLGYTLFEVPSNMILARVGARLWIARIMITWGLVAAAMMFVRTPVQFYALRVLLGITEAGFFPGIIYYLGLWFPGAWLARAMAHFMVGIPLASVLGGPLGGALLGLDGRLGLSGWQWLFLLEGIPAVLLGLAVFAVLRDRPADAGWLSGEQRAWLAERLRRDEAESAAPHDRSALRALADRMLWLTAVPSLVMATALNAYTFWAPTVIRDTLHTDNLTTGVIVGGIACLAAAAALAAGASSDRTGERFLHAAGSACIVTLGYVGAALLPWPLARIGAFAWVLIGYMSFLPAYWCLPTKLLRGSAAAAGIALVNSIANVGGFVGPNLVGTLKDATGGTTAPFVTLAALPLVAVTLLLMLRQRATFATH